MASNMAVDSGHLSLGQQKNLTESDIEALNCNFVEPFPEDLQPECAICLQILKKPQILSCCGYSFCVKCIEPMKTRECPLCRQKDFKMVPDKRMERLVNQRKVYCLLRKKGCKWTGERRKLSDHLRINARRACDDLANACQYFPERCESCAVLVCRKDMGDHRAKCDHRLAPCYFCAANVIWKNHTVHYQTCPSGPKQCKFCGVYVSKIEMANHMAKCDAQPATCEFCGTTVSLKDLLVHYGACPSGLGLCPNANCSKRMRTTDLAMHAAQCPYGVIDCKYRYVGCQERIYRKDLPGHLERNAKKHEEMLDTCCRNLHVCQAQLSEKLRQAEVNAGMQGNKIAGLQAALTQAKQVVPVQGNGGINFLLVSDLSEYAHEGDVKSRFGQYGIVTYVHLLPDSFASAIVVYEHPGAYYDAIEASRTSGIRLCQEFVQVQPIYSVNPEDPYEFDDYYY